MTNEEIVDSVNALAAMVENEALPEFLRLQAADLVLKLGEATTRAERVGLLRGERAVEAPNRKEGR